VRIHSSNDKTLESWILFDVIPDNVIIVVLNIYYFLDLRAIYIVEENERRDKYANY